MNIAKLNSIFDFGNELFFKLQYSGVLNNSAWIAAGTVAISAIILSAYYFFTSRPAGDLPTILDIGKEIKDLNVVIGDGASYSFTKAHGKFINEHKTKQGSLGMLAAAGQVAAARRRGEAAQYGDNPEDILKLGQGALRDKSGQCDHMAAAVIAKIVEKIQSGIAWNSRVELLGNGAHAFVVIGRAENSDLHDPTTWGKQAIVIDTWLANLGAKEDSGLVEGINGVISDPKDVQNNMNCFGAERLRVVRELKPEDLHKLARKTEKF